MSNVYLISIEGNIGSGKSTFLENLRQHLHQLQQNQNIQVVFAPEPVNIWQGIKDKDGVSILEKFYQDQEKYAFSFQMMAYISRLSILRKMINDHTQSERKMSPLFIITERSLYTDRYIFAKMLYDQHKINEIDYQIYLQWFDEFAIPITHCVYLRSDPSICNQRVKKRARQGEEIPLSYLELCHTYHEQYVEMFPDRLVLDGNQDIHKCPWIIDEWIQKVDRMIHQK